MKGATAYKSLFQTTHEYTKKHSNFGVDCTPQNGDKVQTPWKIQIPQ